MWTSPAKNRLADSTSAVNMKIPKPKIPTDAQDVEVLAEMGLAPVQKSHAIAVAPNTSVEQAKTDSVNALLTLAYTKASTLELSADEIKRLTADFDDADFQRGAGGDPNLIYLEHKALRDRLNQVIGLGKWANIVRRTWSEEFPVAAKPNKPASVAVRIYIESVLLVRGCYVGEAIGDGTYYKSNASGNYGDAYESAKTAAFRRCCKDWGIGLQAFSKDFSEEWKSKYKGFDRPERKTKA